MQSLRGPGISPLLIRLSCLLPHSLEIKLLEAACASVWDVCDLIQESVVPAEGTRKVGIKKSALMET